MKSTKRILAAVVLASSALGLQTNPPAPAPIGSNRPSQTGYVLKPIPFSAVHHQQSGFPRIRLWESTSANWSGYAVPREGSGVTDTFSGVEGTWTVPLVTGNDETTYASTWVGLDGYDDDTVEQTGTEQDWTAEGQQNYAWFEMYPGGAYEIVGFPVDPGDAISAQVRYVGTESVRISKNRSELESVFQLTIVNNTKNVSFAIPTSYTTIPSAARASAEWVLEAPWSGEILPLADYGAAGFSDCNATSTRSSGQPKPVSFWPYDPLTMIDPSGGQATPSVLLDNGTAFSVSWSQ